MTEARATTRENLRWIVDHLPECHLEGAGQTLLEYLKKRDPLLYALATAPEDDPTEDEIAAVEEAYEDIARRRAKLSKAGLSDEEIEAKLWIPHEEVMKRLLELP